MTDKRKIELFDKLLDQVIEGSGDDREDLIPCLLGIGFTDAELAEAFDDY